MNEHSTAAADDRQEGQSALVADAGGREFGAIGKLTLPARRLAGSPACLNCGTELKGPFCYHCGQPDRNFLRFFPALLREFLEDFLDLDSRFLRTMKPLLFKPGRLTRDYLNGRRFRYTPPMRLYLLSSIAFFLLAAAISTNAINLSVDRQGAGKIFEITSTTPEETEKIEQALAQLPEHVRAQVELNREPVTKNGMDTDELVFNGEPWDRETNPLIIPLMPDRFNNWLNDEIQRSPEKADQISENPRIIVEKVFDLLPGTMFVLLPFVALIFKFWYLFARRYYIEHLIFALHNHAFIFVCLMLILLFSLFESWIGDGSLAFMIQPLKWLQVAIYIWIPIYLLLSLRHVYRQNWFLTLGKYAVIGISYISLLGAVTGFVALLSFLLL